VSEPLDRLEPATIMRRLTTRWMGRTLYCHEEVGSTNDVGRELARAGAPEGTVVIAERQTRGRGRLGRTWESPPYRNLYLSAIWRPAAAAGPIACLSLVAGVAVCDAVREHCPAVLKWPNDVLVAGRKVAGLLAEVDAAGAVIMGIGVNLNVGRDEFPPALRDKAGSLRAATGTRVDRPAFTARLLAHLEARYDQHRQAGFAPIAEAWCERSMMVGKTIEVDEPLGRVRGVVFGLDGDGALTLRLAGGNEHRVVAGDVTVVDGYGLTTDEASKPPLGPLLGNEGGRKEGQ
jgi:BirA family biotin operon repressor/biotin-[acetyl-CoA-carboxylase] ligase